MGKREAITIGAVFFKTKKDLTLYVQGILRVYRPGDQVSVEHAAFLYALLCRHPNCQEKTGRGIAGFKVQKTIYGNAGFVIVRSDGTETDFSFMRCITPRSQIADFKQACRNMVHGQVWAFKISAFTYCATIKCPVTGEDVTVANAHVDHEPPHTFDNLVSRFCEAIQVNPETVEICGYSDGEMEKWFADEELRKAWQEFHRRNAVLRIVSKQANLSIIKKGLTQ